MGERVSPQIHFPVEGPRADGADEGLVSRVLPAVRDEVGRLAERLATLGALVRLLARVDVRVLLHVGLLVKPLAAVLARKRARVRVDEHVRGEGGGALEALAALLALEHLLVRVHGHVLLQANRVPERFPADVTLEGSTARVRSPYVDLESVRGIEPLLTLGALEGAGVGVEKLAFGGKRAFFLFQGFDGSVLRFLQEVVQVTRSAGTWPAVCLGKRAGSVEFFEKRREKIWESDCAFVGCKFTSYSGKGKKNYRQRLHRYNKYICVHEMYILY